jgi:hypothetical protein
MLTADQINESMAKMGHTLHSAEVEVIRTVCQSGAAVGYGNLINWLSTAWAVSLVTKWGMTEEQARRGALGHGYPLPTLPTDPPG